MLVIAKYAAALVYSDDRVYERLGNGPYLLAGVLACWSYPSGVLNLKDPVFEIHEGMYPKTPWGPYYPNDWDVYLKSNDLYSMGFIRYEIIDGNLTYILRSDIKPEPHVKVMYDYETGVITKEALDGYYSDMLSRGLDNCEYNFPSSIRDQYTDVYDMDTCDINCIFRDWPVTYINSFRIGNDVYNRLIKRFSRRIKCNSVDLKDKYMSFIHNNMSVVDSFRTYLKPYDDKPTFSVVFSNRHVRLEYGNYIKPNPRHYLRDI